MGPWYQARSHPAAKGVRQKVSFVTVSVRMGTWYRGRSHPAAKRVRQKEFGKKVTEQVTEASEEVTETRWTFRIFFIFSALGRGRGSPRRQGCGASVFSLKITGGGGGVPREGAGLWEVPGGCLRGIWGGRGGAKYFFRGRNSHQGKSPENEKKVFELLLSTSFGSAP